MPRFASSACGQPDCPEDWRRGIMPAMHPHNIGRPNAAKYLDALDVAAETWRNRYAKGAFKDELPATVINTCLKRLSRALVPLASTARGTYGHDVYGYTPQRTMIPSLYDVPRLAKLQPDSEDRWMLEVQLIRDRNRVADAL